MLQMRLPSDILFRILMFSTNPAQACLAHSDFHQIMRRFSSKLTWLYVQYGQDMFYRVIQTHQDLFKDNPENLKLLLEFVQRKSLGGQPVPRYLLQQAIHSFINQDRAHLVMVVIEYGLQFYKHMGLQENDAMKYKKYLRFLEEYHRQDARIWLQELDALIDKYRFDVNFCSPIYIYGYWDRESGYDILMRHVKGNRAAAVRWIVRKGGRSHCWQSKNELETFYQNYMRNGPWHMFQLDNRDCLVQSVMERRHEMLDALLCEPIMSAAESYQQDNTAECTFKNCHFYSEIGMERLRIAMQIAVDKDETEMSDLLHDCIHRHGHSINLVKKSPLQLEDELENAIEKSDRDSIEMLVRNGAKLRWRGTGTVTLLWSLLISGQYDLYTMITQNFEDAGNLESESENGMKYISAEGSH